MYNLFPEKQFLLSIIHALISDLSFMPLSLSPQISSPVSYLVHFFLLVHVTHTLEYQRVTTSIKTNADIHHKIRITCTTNILL